MRRGTPNWLRALPSRTDAIAGMADAPSAVSLSVASARRDGSKNWSIRARAVSGIVETHDAVWCDSKRGPVDSSTLERSCSRFALVARLTTAVNCSAQAGRARRGPTVPITRLTDRPGVRNCADATGRGGPSTLGGMSVAMSRGLILTSAFLCVGSGCGAHDGPAVTELPAAPPVTASAVSASAAPVASASAARPAFTLGCEPQDSKAPPPRPDGARVALRHRQGGLLPAREGPREGVDRHRDEEASAGRGGAVLQVRPGGRGCVGNEGGGERGEGKAARQRTPGRTHDQVPDRPFARYRVARPMPRWGR